jgi:hypothetical protein
VLEGKLTEAKSKKETLKARAASAKTSKQIQEMMGNLNTSNASVAFDKMEEKVGRPRAACMLLGPGSSCWARAAELASCTEPTLSPDATCLARVTASISLPRHPGAPPPSSQVMAMEAEAESVTMLVGGDGLEGKFAALEGGSVEDELAALKQGMISSGSRPAAALPEGRPIKDAIDMELDMLRKKARE